MQAYLIKRFLFAIPTVIGVSVLIFLAMRVLPGDPIAGQFSEEGMTQLLTEEELYLARESLGLNDPLPVQYGRWMWGVVRLDFGTSFWRNDPIGKLLARRLPLTLEIAFLTMAVAVVVGVPIGVVSAMRRNSLTDYVSRFFVNLFLAIPSFWLGSLTIMVGILAFQWRPPLTIIYPWDDLGANFQIVVGPVLALGLGIAAVIARITRSSVLDVLTEDYVRTAHAKGLRARLVLVHHVLRNAMLPVVTISGLALGSLLGGSVAVEKAFGVNGMGSALIFALGERDWVMIQDLVLVYGVIFIGINLLVDLSYGFFDARVRYE